MWNRTEDGSVVDGRGKVIFFSADRFARDICLGDCCFICGAKPEEKIFNNEHILPEWVLRRYDLFSRTITLPNGQTVPYGRYKLPCCEDCNSLMGKVIEEPISRVVAGGAGAINDYISGGHLFNMFVWMGLIYLKTHLKDRVHRVHLDLRKGNEKIADVYDWNHLHHIHCLVRCFYTGCSAEVKTLGSFLALPVKCNTTADNFDYADLYEAQTMLLRLGEVGLVVVFNDSQSALKYCWQWLQKITGPVSELQFREVMTELAYLNQHLKGRSIFTTDCDLEKGECTNVASGGPPQDLLPLDLKVRGRLLHKMMHKLLSRIQVPGCTSDQIAESIKAGRFTVLFNEKGEFITQGSSPQ